MEPERRIEKLLRAFAKKRREQAGEPAELRPFVRQQLQAEISRRPTKKSGGGFFTSFLLALQPRLAFALCVIAIVCIGGWLLLPALKDRKPATLAAANPQSTPVAAEEKNQPTLAPAPSASPPAPVAVAAENRALRDTTRLAIPENAASRPEQPNVASVNREPIAPVKATPANLLDNGMASTSSPARRTVASTPSTDKETFAFKSDGAAVDTLANHAPLNKDSANGALPALAPPTETRGVTVTAATLAANQPARNQLEAQKKPAPSAIAAADFYAVAKDETKAAAPSISHLFNRTEAASTRQHAAGALSDSALVLASFRVEQNGGEMRVVDADGSVYTGSMQLTRDESAPIALLPAKLKNQPPAAQMAKVRPQPQAAQNYFFRVAGTNRNLNENVVFSGNLILLTNTISPWTNIGAFGGAAGARSATPASSVSSLLSNSRISGKAVIGNQKEIEVNAASAP